MFKPKKWKLRMLQSMKKRYKDLFIYSSRYEAVKCLTMFSLYYQELMTHMKEKKKKKKLMVDD